MNLYFVKIEGIYDFDHLNVKARSKEEAIKKVLSAFNHIQILNVYLIE
tara:strand:+ start:1591 stop:1734 length:144 start_codon:yes stop_codon:yes gene_type:complete